MLELVAGVAIGAALTPFWGRAFIYLKAWYDSYVNHDVAKYTWKPDVPDHRDRLFKPKITALPDHVDKIGTGNPVEDQGSLGSCTGNATTTAVEIVTSSKQLSRLYCYYHGRLLENSVREDSGAMIRDVIKGVKMYGISTESYWPYIIRRFAVKPNWCAYLNGKKILPKIAGYERVVDLVGMKAALAKGLPVIFGFMVPAYFDGPEVETNGWVRLPTNQDQMVGGHAVVAVGYDDRFSPYNPEGFIWVKNSWGPTWGLNGYFKMPYSWFTDPRMLVDDMWVVHPK